VKSPNTLRLEDRVTLPLDVAVAPTGIRDEVRSVEIPCNEAALVTLASIDGATLAELAQQLQNAYTLHWDRAERDARAFVGDLNSAWLVNVDGIGPRRRVLCGLVGAGLSALGGVRPEMPRPPARRTPIDTRTKARAAVTTAAAVAPGSLSLALVSTSAFVLVAALGGFLFPGIAMSLAIALIAGPMLHEAGHALGLARGSKACVVTAGFRAFVVQGSQAPRRRLVAAAGPIACVLGGAGTAVVGAALAQPWGFLIGGMLAAHAIGLTALSPDGRNACDLR
jgi:hypothetical protein